MSKEQTKKAALESYIRGLAQDVSMGTSDEIAGRLESAAGSLGLVPDKTYEQSVKESRDAYKQAEQDNPKSYMAGEMTGTVGSMLIPGGIAKVGANAARKLALKNMTKGLTSAYGRSDGGEMNATDVGLALSNALPISKMTSKLPEWKAGKGVKILADKEIKDGSGKVIQKLDPLQEARDQVKGKVIQKLDPKQEAEMLVKGNVDWKGRNPLMNPSKPQPITMGNAEAEAAKIALARQRIAAQKELQSADSSLNKLKQEMKEGEQSLPLAPSIRREFMDKKIEDVQKTEQQKNQLLDMLSKLK